MSPSRIFPLDVFSERFFSWDTPSVARCLKKSNTWSCVLDGDGDGDGCLVCLACFVLVC